MEQKLGKSLFLANTFTLLLLLRKKWTLEKVHSTSEKKKKEIPKRSSFPFVW